MREEYSCFRVTYLTTAHSAFSICLPSRVRVFISRLIPSDRRTIRIIRSNLVRARSDVIAIGLAVSETGGRVASEFHDGPHGGPRARTYVDAM